MTATCPHCSKPLNPETGVCAPCILSQAVSSDEGILSLQERPDPARLRSLGGYEIIRQIGRGGMGIIFLARHRALNRTVALKLLTGGALASEEMIKRFKAEAELAAALKHPHIVPIYEIGDHEGEPYFSMAHIDGSSLAEVADEQPLELKRAAKIMVKVAGAVHYAHQRGVLHRDLKPSNILLDQNDEPHLTDFGIAKLLNFDSGMTRTNNLLGTPSYVAPEVARGENGAISISVDVYGLGAVLYQLITGSPPFAGGTSMATLRQVVDMEARAPSIFNTAIDPDLQTITLKSLEKDPVRRYESALAFAEDLTRWLEGEPIQARPVGWFERAAKWVKRHPIYAVLIGSLSISIILGTVGLTWQWQRAEEQKVLAEQHRRTAERNRAIADAQRDLSRNQAYAADIRTAQLVHKEGQVDRAVALLNSQAPKQGDPDLRSIDWRFLWRSIHALPEHTWEMEGPGATVIKPAGHGLGAFLEQGGARCVIRSMTNGVVVASFAPDKPFTVMDYFPAGGLAAGGTSMGELQVAEFSSGQVRWAVQRPATIEDVAFSKDGRWIAASHRTRPDANRRLQTELFDARTGELVSKLPMKGGADLTFSQRSEFLFLREENNAFGHRLADGAQLPYNVSSPFFCYALTQSKGEVGVCMMNPREIYTFPANETSTLQNRRIWAHPEQILALGAGPPGSFLSVGAEGALKLWDTETGRELRRMPLPLQKGPVTICLAGNMVSVISGRRVTTSSLKAFQQPTLVAPQDRIIQGKPAIAPNGKLAAFSVQGGKTEVVNLQTGGALATFTGAFRAIAFSGDSTTLFVLDAEGIEDVRLVHWDFEKDTKRSVALPQAHLGNYILQPGGDWLAGGKETGLALWSTRDGTLKTFGSNTPAEPIAFTPDGEFLVARSGREIQVWSLADLTLHKSFTLEPPISSAALSRDGDRLAVGSDMGKVTVHTFPTFVQLLEFHASPHPVASLEFGHDWNILAVEPRFQAPTVWDLRTGRELLTFAEELSHLVWLPNGLIFLRPYSRQSTTIHSLPSLAEIAATQSAAGYAQVKEE